MNTQIAKDIDSTAYQASYDRCCKTLLAHRKILAHIMKECIDEFKEFDVNYIAQKCIESTPEISETAVHRNSKMPEKIMGMNTEDKTVDEGAVYFDIRFIAGLPQTGERIKLIINLEAQNNFYPGYSLVRRGLYYCCRLVSSQYETEFTEDNYNDIKKVYSIWICTNTPAYAQNTITRYKITEENVIGKIKENIKNYDLINVIMVCLDKDSSNTESDYGGILKFLRILLSDMVNPEQKKMVLNNDFGIEMDIKLEKGLSEMCNLSEGVLERGRKEGLEIGLEKGIEISKVEDLKNLMEGACFTFEKAAIILKIPESKWEKYKDKLQI